MPVGRAQNSEIGPFPPAPRPLYIGSWTLKAQYPLYVVFTLFGCSGGARRGGALKGSRAQPASTVSQPRRLKNGTF